MVDVKGNDSKKPWPYIGALAVGGRQEERRVVALKLGWWIYPQKNGDTLPKTNIAPTNGWLEYYFPIGEAYFQGLC